MNPHSLPGTIPALVTRAADRFGAREGLVDEHRRLTFAALSAEVDRIAAALIATGVRPADRIAIWAPNMLTWPIVALGVQSVGAVLVPLNTRYKGEEAAYILRTSGARLLFTVTDFLDADYVAMLETAAPGVVDETVVIAGTAARATVDLGAFAARGDAVAPADVVARRDAVRPDDLCDILFTSGTTGAPKGAMLEHGATVRAFDAWATIVGLREGDRYLIVNPFFHAFGLKAGLVAALVKGATMIPHAVFDAPSVMARVAEEQVSMVPGPPAIFQTMLDHPDLGRLDLDSLRLAVTGGAAVPVELIRRMRADLKFETVITGYGLTEATGIATMCRHDDASETIATTAGRPIPDVDVRVVDEVGAELPTGEPGEVVVRGYNVMRGYFENPEATAETIDEDGWLHTGDIGVLDAAGNLRITDRMKDMFIVGGFNAYPAEIEQMMAVHPAVGQVAVVGVPDHRLGEVGVAFVVPRVNTRIDPDELIAWCKERMANYKVPRRVEVVYALPLNASNKVLKYRLREQATAS